MAILILQNFNNGYMAMALCRNAESHFVLVLFNEKNIN